jgi:O-acetyl-ADP-ribose deacetylase (regulator of RNase III)
MIEFTNTDIFKSSAEALVNPVNCVGAMGKGLALQFKQKYPETFKAYSDACYNGEVKIGSMFIFNENGKIIINFPTKKHWSMSSKIEYIVSGLDALISDIKELQIKSISIPKLGCGLGGLDWELVRSILIEKLKYVEIPILIHGEKK